MWYAKDPIYKLMRWHHERGMKISWHVKYDEVRRMLAEDLRDGYRLVEDPIKKFYRPNSREEFVAFLNEHGSGK